MMITEKCVSTTTTAVRGSDWGIHSTSLVGGANENQYAFAVRRVEAELETVAPCAAWYPALSEVHACLTHEEALAEFVGDQSPADFFAYEDFGTFWDLADDDAEEAEVA